MAYQHPIVDRTIEFGVFQAMLQGFENRSESILLLKNESGQGKSKLIQLFEEHCRKNHIPVSKVDFKGGALNPGNVIEAIQMDFRHFSDLQRCNEILHSTIPAPSIGITDNTSLGSTQYNVQIILSGNEWILEAQRIRWEMGAQAMLDALVAATRKGQQNFVILFDTYEQASEELKRWLSNHILRMSTPQRIGSLLIVIAGKEVPPLSGEWESCCHTIHLQPLQLEHWKEYARLVVGDLSDKLNELIERIYPRYQHSPLYMATNINMRVPAEKTSHAAQSFEEETKKLLDLLPEDLRPAAWAAAIPHWFNAEVIAALLPDLASQSSELYLELQKQAFVEPFRGRGHNIHELIRQRILSVWWNERQAEYRRYSRRAQEFFSSKQDDVHAIESAYHYLVSESFDSERMISHWNEIAFQLKMSGQYALAHTLIQNAREHISAGRVSADMESRIGEWERFFANDLVLIGEQRRKNQDLSSATDIFDQAQKFYADAKDELAQAKIRIKLGIAYLQQERSDMAAEQVESALRIYEEQGHTPRKATVYQERGRIFRELEQHQAAIADLNNARADYYRELANTMLDADPENLDYYLTLLSASKEFNEDVPAIYADKARQYIPEGDWYILTRLESISGNFNLAFEALQKAAQDEGFDYTWAWEDPDLQWIRTDPRFVEIVGPKPEEKNPEA